MDGTTMMRMRRFRALLASYGAEPGLWPEAKRPGAEALLAFSAKARALAEAERTVDLALHAAARRTEARPPPDEGEDAALARLRSGIAARIAPLAAPARPGRVGLPLRLAAAGGAVLSGRHLAFGAVASVSVLAGLSIGMLEAVPQAGAPGIAVLLQAAPIAGLP